MGFQILTLVLGVYMAWNIGANDVANAMGTSVGSKALSLRHAVFLAAILEFAGAFFVGSNVSLTIQQGIVAPETFASEPMTFVIGMMGSLLATGVLLQLASYLALPISTTHAIVGAVLGFGWVAGGSSAIYWGKIGSIVLSWIVSPVCSGLASFGLFFLIRRFIFEASNPLRASKKVFPFFVFLCVYVLVLSLFYKGLKLEITIFSAMGCATVVSLVAAGMSYWSLQRAPVLVSISSIPVGEQIEQLFVFLQVLSACLVAFAHGANDVANAIGPVAAVFHVLQRGMTTSYAAVPLWLLAMGGMGIVVGLATWGWRVIETVGKKITELTPSRGFAAELGAASMILIASKMGLPISTTHALVGGLCGVGVARGAHSLNWQLLKEIVISWIITIPLCAGLSIMLFSGLRWMFA